jgi:hypothetical protein
MQKGGGIGFEDFCAGFICTFGLFIVNSLDPALIRGEAFSYSGSQLAWKARLALFFGITCEVGSLFGAITLAVIKYFLKNKASYQGVALILQNLAILISSCCIWSAQSLENDGLYNIMLH